MQLAAIRRHHEAIVAAEQRRYRPEGDLRRVITVLRGQLDQWRQAGGSEADCPLTPLLAAYERRLYGEEAEKPSVVDAAAQAVEVARQTGESAPSEVPAEGPEEPQVEQDTSAGRSRGRKRSEG